MISDIHRLFLLKHTQSAIGAPHAGLKKWWLFACFLLRLLSDCSTTCGALFFLPASLVAAAVNFNTYLREILLLI